MWHRFNPNPQGNGVGDCTVRAVAAATGQNWERAYIGLALTGFILGDMPSANRTWGAFTALRITVRAASTAEQVSGKLTCAGLSAAMPETVTTGVTAMPTEAVIMFVGITPARMAVSA